MNPMDDFFNAPFDDFDHRAGNKPKPHDGMQICMLAKYGPHQTQKKGVIMTADLIVVQPAHGSTYVAGSPVHLAWFVFDSDSTKRRYERKRSDEFITALLGLPPKTQCGQHAAALGQPQQPGRGILLKIHGERNGQYMNYRYEHIPQDNAMIVQHRARLDQLDAANVQASGLPPQPQNMQQAPHPAQMAQQYPAQQQQPIQPQQYAQPYPQSTMMPLIPQQQPAQPQQPAAAPMGIPGFKLPF